MRQRHPPLFCTGLVSLLLAGCSGAPMQEPTRWTVSSPGDQVRITVHLEPDTASGTRSLAYAIDCGGGALLGRSPLGIERTDQRFSDGLSVTGTRVRFSDATYELLHGKRKVCRDTFRELTLSLENASGAPLDLIVRAYDDGAAFRYSFPDTSDTPRTVVKESTGFLLPAGVRIWAHPYDKATEYSPAYETYYEVGMPAGTPCPLEEGWAFPVLFQAGKDGPWGLEVALRPRGGFVLQLEASKTES